MTVSSSTNKNGPYAGDGSTKTFPFTIQTLVATDIKVVSTTPVNTVNTDTTLTYNVDYTVSLNADQTASPGGSVTLTTAPATGTSISILRNITQTQGAAFPNQGGFYPAVLEKALDKLTMMVQQNSEVVGRCIQGSPADSVTTIQGLAASVSAAALAATATPIANAAASATAAATSATAAAASATAAAASAATAQTAPATNSSSTTSLTIATGSKTLTIETGKAIVVGMSVKVAITASPTNWMFGDVTAYNPATGALTVNVTSTSGSGTASAWTVSISGPAGANAALGAGTINGAGTLNASIYSYEVTPTGYGQAVTLDVGTNYKLGAVHSVKNTSTQWPAPILDNGGTLRGFIPPRTTVTVACNDNTAPAGKFDIAGIDLLGVTAFVTPSSSSTNTWDRVECVAVDANRQAIIYTDGNPDMYMFIYDKSTGLAGSATLIRASIQSQAFRAVLQAANQICIVSCDTTTGLQACVVPLTGTTVGTPVVDSSQTLAGTYSSFGNIVMNQGVAFFTYSRATTTAAVRAISFSGTTPSIGSENTQSGTGVALASNGPRVYVYSSTIVWVTSCTSSNVYVKPYTFAGNVMSAGTQANTACTVSAYASRAFGNGNLGLFYTNTNLYGAVASMSGTVASISAVSLGTSVQNATTHADFIAVGSNKILAFSDNASTSAYFNILKDTGGTASAGTELVWTFSSINGNLRIVGLSGTEARCWTTSSTSANVVFRIECSGNSPTLTEARSIPINTTIATIKAPASVPSAFGTANENEFGFGTAFALAMGTNSTGWSSVFDGGFYVSKFMPLADSAGCKGASAYESWIAQSKIFHGIAKVEMAQL